MRAIAAIVFLAAVSLSGCDNQPALQTAQAVHPPALVPLPPALPAASAASQSLHRTARYHRSRDEYSQSSSESSSYSESRWPDYSSSSQSSSSQSYSEDNGPPPPDWQARHDDRAVWIDGYGRKHHESGSVTFAATMTGKRLAPWHGYNSKCRNNGERE